MGSRRFLTVSPRILLIDETHRVGLGLGKEKEQWEPVEAFSVVEVEVNLL